MNKTYYLCRIYEDYPKDKRQILYKTTDKEWILDKLLDLVLMNPYKNYGIYSGSWEEIVSNTRHGYMQLKKDKDFIKSIM